MSKYIKLVSKNTRWIKRINEGAWRLPNTKLVWRNICKRVKDVDSRAPKVTKFGTLITVGMKKIECWNKSVFALCNRQRSNTSQSLSYIAVSIIDYIDANI